MMSVFGVTNVVGLEYVQFEEESTGTVYDTRNWGYFRAPTMKVPDAKARGYEVTIPGRDGTLDLTEALGGVYFENREITLEFLYDQGSEERFHYESSRIRNIIDGKVFRVSASTDMGYFWLGRCSVDTSMLGRDMMKLTVTVDAGPHKLSVSSSYEAWRWSPFSFVDGVVTQPSDVTLSNQTKTVTLPVDPARGKPALWLNSGAAGAVTARLSSSTLWLSLKPGKNVFPEIRMSDKEQRTLVLRGTGSVGVEYRLGSL